MNNHQIKIETIEANPVRGFEVMSLGGGVPFVKPYGATLSPDQAMVLDFAGEMASAGRVAVASAICAKLQHDLGVTQELYISAVLAGAQRVALQQRRARADAKALEAKRVEALVVSEPAPSETREFIVEEIGRLQQDLAAVRVEIQKFRADGYVLSQGSTLRKKRDGILEALHLAQAREAAARRASSHEAWLKRSERETHELAWARGETVVVERDEDAPEVVRSRVKNRDGLYMLHQSGALSDFEWKAGRAFRLCFEAASAGLRIANMQGVGGGGDDSELQRMFLTAKLGQLEALIRAGRNGGRRLTAVRLVAGEGRCIREIVKGGSARTRMTAALQEGLEILSIALGLANRGH